MGDFTKKLINAVPVGHRRYELGGVSFFLNLTGKEVLAQVVSATVKALQESGNFEAARQMTENPQPFFNNPGALAVFMLTVEALEDRDRQIAELRARVDELAKRIQPKAEA